MFALSHKATLFIITAKNRLVNRKFCLFSKKFCYFGHDKKFGTCDKTDKNKTCGKSKNRYDYRNSHAGAAFSSEKAGNDVFALVCKGISCAFDGGNNFGIIKAVEEYHKRDSDDPDKKICDYGIYRQFFLMGNGPDDLGKNTHFNILFLQNLEIKKGCGDAENQRCKKNTDSETVHFSVEKVKIRKNEG